MSSLRFAPVSGTIEQQQRFGSEEHLEDGVGLAGPKTVSGSPVKICLMAPGSVKKTIGGRPSSRTVNVSPYRSAQACMNGSGAKTHLSN